MKISIIIPVFNCEEYLNRCLHSVLNQNFDSFEIIVINDGSTDKSLEVIKRIHAQNPAKIKFYDQKNMGQSNARNRGLDLARGDYICFIDSDDWISPNFLKEMYEEAEDKGAEITTCDYKIMFENNINYTKNALDKLTSDTVKNFIMSPPGPCAKLYKKHLFEKERFPTGIIYEDLALLPYIGACANKVAHVSDVYYYYYQRKNSTMNQSYYNEKFHDIFLSVQFLYDKFQNTKYFKIYEKELEYLVILHFLYYGSIRFLPHKNRFQNIKKITNQMNLLFPNWEKNKYYNKLPKYDKINIILISKHKLIVLYIYRYLNKKMGGN